MADVTVQRRKVRRSVTLTACNGQRVNRDTGEIENYTETLVGTYDALKATRALRRSERDETIVILNTETETDIYEMSIYDFIKYAKKG